MVRKTDRSALDNSVDKIIPPRFIKKGRQEVATYLEQQVPEYRDNPLIESLPPIWTRDEVEERLAYFPPSKTVDIGMMCCSPQREGFEVTFSDFSVGPAISKELHD